MRKLITGLVSSFIFISANGHAIEPVLDQHAMLYYQIPLGAANGKEARHNFGFRFDRQMIQPGEVIQYQSLMRQQAVVDVRMGYAGLQELQVNGIDYAGRYHAQHAATTEEAEGNGKGEEVKSGEAKTEEAKTEEGNAEEKKDGTGKFMHDLPFGVIMGVGILGALLLNND